VLAPPLKREIGDGEVDKELRERVRISALMGLAVLMVNLLFGHSTSPFLTRFPSLAPVSNALTLGIHWILFGSPIGPIHAICRTILCTATFFVFPAHQICAVSFASCFDIL